MQEYTLRKLCSKDIFPMINIISKIGINEFLSCFKSDEVKNLIAGKDAEDNQATTMLGVSIALEIGNVVLRNIGQAEQEIYSFLANISGMKKKDIENLDMGTFIQMIMDVIRKEEFKDFIGVVSGLLKSEN